MLNFEKKIKERAFKEEVKMFQPKTVLARPTSYTLAPSRTT